LSETGGVRKKVFPVPMRNESRQVWPLELAVANRSQDSGRDDDDGVEVVVEEGKSLERGHRARGLCSVGMEQGELILSVGNSCFQFPHYAGCI